MKITEGCSKTKKVFTNAYLLFFSISMNFLATIAYSAPISLITTYTQNFDTLASGPPGGTSSTLPAGWEFFETGASDATTYRIDDGDSPVGDTYSYGLEGSPDRAFGMLRDNNFFSVIGASFTNNTGYNSPTLQIGYKGEQWRSGNLGGSLDKIIFEYSTNATSLNSGTWTSVSQLDFTSVDNLGGGGIDGNFNAIGLSANVTIPVAIGATFWIRWTDSNLFGFDNDGLAIDDFSITLDQCGNGVVNTGEECDGTPCCTSSCQFAAAGDACADDLNACTADTCDAGHACQHTAAPAGTVCRAAVPGGCDIAETCSGTTCPADGVVASGTVCRAASGQCDVAESCNGSNACPANGFASAATSCTGTSNGGTCDGSDHCSGTSNTCVDVFAPASTVCRSQNGQCDVAEKCTGNSGACPADVFASAATACTGASDGGACDGTDHCFGPTSNTCVDGFQPIIVQCRASAGQCDVAENCDGSSGACPADGFASAATACIGTSNGGACDGTDLCSGTSNSCVDGFQSSLIECRASEGQCDVAENCTGSSGACPADAFASETKPCTGTSNGGVCDGTDHCFGPTANTCVDEFQSSVVVCRTSGGECDFAENCTGSSGACPSDEVKGAGTLCTSDGQDCTTDECDGTLAHKDCQHPVELCSAEAQIAPTGTTCQQFRDHLSSPLTTIQYSLDKKGVIGSASPGVFFYYVALLVPATSQNITIQEDTGDWTRIITAASSTQKNDSNVRLFNNSCVGLNAKITYDGARIIIDPASTLAAGTYIVSVKYNSQSLKGYKPPAGFPSNTYTFETLIGVTPVAPSLVGVDVAPK